MVEQDLAKVYLGALYTLMPRVGGAFMFLPFLPAAVPQLVVKMGLSLSVCIYFLPLAIGNSGWLDLDPFSLALLFIKEVALGVILGLAFGVVWQAISAAGAIIDTVAGTANGSLLDPTTNQEAGLYNVTLGTIATLVIVLAGGIKLVITALAWSFVAFPVMSWQWPNTGQLFILADWSGTEIFSIAMKIAAPAIIVLGLLDVTFGFIGRQVQQLSSASITAGLKAMINLLMMFLGVAALFDYIVQQQNLLFPFIKTFLTR
jgi:type III secretion protein T